MVFTINDQGGWQALKAEIKKVICSRCGRPFSTERRFQQVVEKVTADWGPGWETPEWMSLCPECRKNHQALALANVAEAGKSEPQPKKD